MVDLDGCNLGIEVGWLGLRVGGCLVLNLHSSTEQSELSQ